MRVGIGSVAVVMAAMLAAGCQSNRTAGEAQGELARGTESHIVVCWLKEPGNAEQRRQVIERSKAFREIPGVVSVAAGTPLPSIRPVVDSSFDVAVVIRFRDEAAMRAYGTNPIHQQAVREVLNPLVKKMVIYDVLDE
jgi:hypothetical protein